MKRFLCVLAALCLMMAPAFAATINIPESLTVIPDEMFEGSTGMTTVVVPDTVTSIGSKAFANTSITSITIHSNVKLIADDAFDGCSDDLVAYVNTGSYAETYFKAKGIATMPSTIHDALSSYTCTKTAWSSMDSIFYRRVLTSSKTTSKQCVATLYDITSGLSFSIRRVGADNHADIETMTSSDTATLCKMLGVSSVSQISSSKHYQRRPCLLILGKHLYACSLYAVPHDGGRPSTETLLSNGLNGYVMCLHFYGSKTAGTNKSDSGHQTAVNTAYTWWQTNYGN